VLKVGRLLERRHIPVQVLHPAINVGVIVSNRAEIAFKVTMVDWVESDLPCELKLVMCLMWLTGSTYNGGVQANVGLGQPVADIIVLSFDHLLQAVQ
jgi:hypothetical protein